MPREPKTPQELRRKFSQLGAAGKGDKPRPQDEELTRLGEEIVFAETEEERQYWTRQWRAAMDKRIQDRKKKS